MRLIKKGTTQNKKN